MSDPTIVAGDTPGWLGEWAWKGLTALVGLLGVDTMRRTRRLELTSKTTADAAADRAEVKAELAAMATRMESNRIEQKQDTQRLGDHMEVQHGRLFARMDELADLIRSTRS